MVRLKDAAVNFPFTDILFQFLYGAIKSSKHFDLFGLIESFQFLYGAIKRVPQVELLYFFCYFNSCMVRLKVAGAESVSSECYISIPVWCD